MARITVEDCLDKQNNRFSLISLAAKRAKQLLNGAPILLEKETDNKSVVNALREIAAGKVGFMTEEDLAERKAVEDAKKAELIEKHKKASEEEVGAELFNADSSDSDDSENDKEEVKSEEVEDSSKESE